MWKNLGGGGGGIRSSYSSQYQNDQLYVFTP